MQVRVPLVRPLVTGVLVVLFTPITAVVPQSVAAAEWHVSVGVLLGDNQGPG
ncbi:hypothetical protein AB0I72_25890 [Nocardiopsis sp. NPDC049922]|uniref:hypothetical protein n=1 Tax=Nocardiopsis sp. NPDC049922 TaxID=3155157 RepID=UPI0033CCD580